MLTTQSTRALAKARNDGLTLGAAASGAGDAGGDGKPIAGLLDSLVAVVPTGIVATYTLFATVARSQMLSRGAEERSAFQTEQLASPTPPNSQALDKLLAARPLESEYLIEFRWGVLVLAGLVAVVLAVQAVHAANQESANKRKHPWLSFEPLAPMVAFVGWALATPGTPLGAYLSTDDMAFASVGIAVAAGLLLLTVGTKLMLRAKTPGAGESDNDSKKKKKATLEPRSDAR